jgi:hypothetical protein
VILETATQAHRAARAGNDDVVGGRLPAINSKTAKITFLAKVLTAPLNSRRLNAGFHRKNQNAMTAEISN